jgi:hypothetical protein
MVETRSSWVSIYITLIISQVTEPNLSTPGGGFAMMMMMMQSAAARVKHIVAVATFKKGC